MLKMNAQTKVVVEGIQVYSNMMPNANYWHLKNPLPIVNALEEGLFKSLDLAIDKSITPTITLLNKNSQIGKITVNWTNTDQIPLHAYVELYEMEPSLVYRNNLVDIPETKKDSIHSFWFIGCSLINQDRKIQFKKTILMSLQSSPSIGMGYELDYPVSSGDNIFNAIFKGVATIKKQTTDLELIEAKVPATYATDNLWMPIISGKPRIILDTTKEFVKFSSNESQHLLRLPAANLIKVDAKNKSENYRFNAYLPIIKQSDKSFTNEYYQASQLLRDVSNDINYTLETLLEFEPYPEEQNANQPIKFVSDSVNKIYADGKLIGKFSVKENIKEIDNFFNRNIIFNGFDSSSKINIGTLYEKTPIISSKVITGSWLEGNYKISINYYTQLKTIYYNDKVIAVVNGDKKPRQMVLLDPLIKPTILNALLMIAYAESFQMPSQN